MLLVLANYPDEKTQKEGMSQRMIAVDEQLDDRPRQYLFVSHRLFWQREKETPKPGLVQYRCNLFAHFFFILRLLRQSKTVYIHSVINVLPWLPLVPFLPRRARVIVDAHGVVPEEATLGGNRTKAWLYGLSERLAMRRADMVITVTKAMETHFRQKYPQSKARYETCPILPAHIVGDGNVDLAVQGEEDVHVVYSGNAQPWQNIELMLAVIRENRSPRIKCHILTGDIPSMRRHLEEAGLADDPHIELATVPPDALRDYYRMAHYGFILRDDITVNRVACPTKLVEYLHYGVIPIVKQPEIGDFNALGYEYIHHEDFSTALRPRKSARNHALAAQLVRDAQQTDLARLIDGNG